MSISFLKQTEKQFNQYMAARRKLGGLSGDALSTSKRVIFSVHRDQMEDAKRQLDHAEKRFVEAEKLIKRIPGLANEGIYKAALEENAEAFLFYTYVKNGKVGNIHKRLKGMKTLIGGASDFTGELVRYTIKQATLGNLKDVRKATKMVEDVVGFLHKIDLTGDLRQKFDQAKRNLRKMEEIAYDLSLRNK